MGPGCSACGVVEAVDELKYQSGNKYAISKMLAIFHDDILEQRLNMLGKAAAADSSLPEGSFHLRTQLIIDVSKDRAQSCYDTQHRPGPRIHLQNVCDE